MGGMQIVKFVGDIKDRAIHDKIRTVDDRRRISG